jgi:hypothetical protein
VKRLALTTVLATLIAAAPAAACSSGSATSVQRRLADADAAFVGRRVARRAGALVFRVNIRVKGRLGRSVRVRWIDTCVSPPRHGRRTGLLLYRVRRHWVATGSDVVAPGELLKAAGIGP